MRKALFVIAAAAIILAGISCTQNGSSSPAAPAAEPTPDAEGYYSVTKSGTTFKWKINGSSIDCKVSAQATGWVSVGFNNSNQMDGSDYVIGYVTGGSTLAISDEHGSGHTHSADSSQDLTDTSGTESGGVTEIVFSRLLDTGDSQDMVLSQNMSLWVILAYSSSDNFTSMHSTYGSANITLY